MRTKLILASALLVLVSTAKAQQNSTFQLQESNLTIKGTSSIHDWEMKALSVSCNTSLAFEDKTVKSFESVNFKCQSNSLKSDHSLMDSKALAAIRAKEYSIITFSLKSGNVSDASSESFSAKLVGTLNLAGKSREIEVPVTGKMLGDSKFHVHGQVEMNMSDFDIDPPTAMFGTITTGDKISLVYDFVFEQEILQASAENN